jgi:transposase-like protein
MKRRRCSDEQILAILKELEDDAIGKEVCRRHCISERTLHRWRRASQQGFAAVTKTGPLRNLSVTTCTADVRRLTSRALQARRSLTVSTIGNPQHASASSM